MLARALTLRLTAAALGALALVVPGCSLGNVSQDDCESNEQCVQAFGAGSRCEEGYCTEGGECVTGHDCRAIFGGGACVEGKCTDSLPTDPACTVVEPENLYERAATGDEARLIFGGIFSNDFPFDEALTTAVRLAVQEFNRSGGGIDGKEFGVVFCDNGGPGNEAEGDERAALNRHALDYLAGTLGVPFIVGPLSSSDATTLIGHETEKGYPTVIISPSATSPSLTTASDRLAETDPFGMFWRTCPSDELQGAVLGGLMGDDELIQKAAVLYLQDVYGEGLAFVVQENFPRTTQLVPFAPINMGDDLTPYRDQLLDIDPDAIVIIAVQATDTIALMETMVGTALLEKKFFFTDGSKDKTIMLTEAPADLKAVINASLGTAPAQPVGGNYRLFATNLEAAFDITASGFAFLAHAYDAAYIGAFGTLYAQSLRPDYDGRLVAEGLSHMIQGTEVSILPTQWSAGKNAMTKGDRTMNVEGISGPLDFNVDTGEAPGPIEVWKVNAAGTDFETDHIVQPSAI